jgi:polyketide synthase 5
MAGSLMGVFEGLTQGDYQLLAADGHSVAGLYGFTATNFSLASGRIVYALGVRGPAATVGAELTSIVLRAFSRARQRQAHTRHLAHSIA